LVTVCVTVLPPGAIAVVAVFVLFLPQVQLVVGAARVATAPNSGCQSRTLVAMFGLSIFVGALSTDFVCSLAGLAGTGDATSATAMVRASTETGRLIVIVDTSLSLTHAISAGNLG